LTDGRQICYYASNNLHARKGRKRDDRLSDFIPLYDYLCSKLDRMPGELHYEIAAAFDHLMRSGLEFDGQVYERENVACSAA